MGSLPTLVKDLGMQYHTENSKRKYRFGLYKCGYCGKEFRVMTKSVITKHTKSCGCLHKASKTTHGVSRHRLYYTWNSMKQRCTNLKYKSYPDYGGRGITICEEWLDVKNFIEWSKYSGWSEGLSIDRIDNDKGYNPDNCRWVDATTQSINQRMQSNNTTGFVGVTSGEYGSWRAFISVNKKITSIGAFKTIEEAVEARDNYIIENNLPHKLSKDYIKKEENV